MFQICTKTKTIQKISTFEAMSEIDQKNCLGKTVFEFFDDAQDALIYDIHEEINDLKAMTKKIQDLTIDDVSQLGLF